MDYSIDHAKVYFFKQNSVRNLLGRIIDFLRPPGTIGNLSLIFLLIERLKMSLKLE